MIEAEHTDGGIIPARAGFTVGRAAPTGPDGDHPRSRGVYTATSAPLSAPRGSSPLARGLLPPTNPTLTSGRIIPARAGFTRRSVWRRRPLGDHPRSRGVYVLPYDTRAEEIGSSPLARGLRRAPWRWPPAMRIIPARAGFT